MHKKHQHQSINHVKNRGQAMVLSLALMSFALMTVLFSYNVSQLNLKGTKLQQTADNTAYSIAAIAARDYNFKAYTNRAAIANQVAVAQMVGLSSWFDMSDTFSTNACRAACWVPYVGQVIKAIQRVVDGMNRVVQPFTKGAIYFESAILRVLSFSQQTMHYAGVTVTATTLPQIVSANDPAARMDWVQNSLLFNDAYNTWFNFQNRFQRQRWRSNAKQYQDFIGVTLDSRDNFSKNRTYNLGFPWSLNLGLVKWQTRKAGGSELHQSKSKAESWSGMDTLSLHYRKWRCGFSGCGWKRSELSLGYGATRSDSRVNIAREHNRRYWGSSRATNSSSSYRAGQNQRTTGGYNGFQPFYEISAGAQQRNHTDNIAVVVSKPQNSIRTTSSVTVGNTRVNPAIGEILPGDRMTALSAAQVHYSRPRDLMNTFGWRRKDNRHEYGNLYNPFWQPRLSDTTNGERLSVHLLTRLL